MPARTTLSPEEIAQSQALVASVFRGFRDELRRVTGSVEFARKGDSSPVTEWDVAVEEALRAALAAEFPHVGFAGEETGSTDADAYWIADPIDGTSSFIRGLDYCTNMAAYIEDGVVRASVIYDFIRDDMYTARLGEGAYKNDEPIHVATDRREGNLVLYSFSRSAFTQLRDELTEMGMRLLLPMGAAGHAFALLAQGKIDGIVSVDTMAGLHDVAPGSLLATEAGATLVRYDAIDTGVSREFIIGAPYVTTRITEHGLL